VHADAEKVAERVSGDRGTLLSRVVRNTFWMLNANLFVRLLNLARGVILARLLVPDDFGLFGLATVVIGFTMIFGDFGVGVFLVYRQDDIERHRATAFWANLGFATLLAGAVAATAPLVGRFFHRRDVVSVLLVLALSLWFYLVSTVHRNLLRKDLRFRALAVADGVGNLLSFVVAVGLAWGGGGVWAFVWSHVVANIAAALLYGIASAWVPYWHFSRESFRALMLFSGWYVGQAVVWYLVLNLDNLLVGRFLGMEALGVYGLAYNYALLPVTAVAGSLGNVVVAELARLNAKPGEFWPSYFESSRLLATMSFPLAAVAFVAAPDLFPVVFGPRWNAGVAPFQILALYGMARCLWMDPFASLGRFDLSFWTACAAAGSSLAAILVGIRSGAAGVAAAVLLVGIATQLGALQLAGGSLRLREGIGQALPRLAAAALAGVAALAARRAGLWLFGERREILLAMAVVVAFGVYALLMRDDLREFLRTFLRSSPPRPQAHEAKAG
jgi:PST family polysaccharide transporter